MEWYRSKSPTHSQQEGPAYNGHFGRTYDHPLFCFNQYEDLERAMLRHGNVHSADERQSDLELAANRYRNQSLERFFQGDVAFAKPGIYEFRDFASSWITNGYKKAGNKISCDKSV